MTVVTVVECTPNKIVQIKTEKNDGYSALVLGFSELKKPRKTKKFKSVKEFKIEKENESEFQKGNDITLDLLKEVKKVKVTGISQGKGFQGSIKRHNFARGPETHGSHFHRRTGSIGACAKPGRVAKGKKMPGRMGNDKKTIENVKIALIDTEKNLLCLTGPVPGSNGSTVIIRTY